MMRLPVHAYYICIRVYVHSKKSKKRKHACPERTLSFQEKKTKIFPNSREVQEKFDQEKPNKAARKAKEKVC